MAGQDISVLCKPESKIRETPIDDTFRATLTMNGVLAEYDITHISIPLSKEKENYIRERYDIREYETETFYTHLAAKISNSIKMLSAIQSQENTSVKNNFVKLEYATSVKKEGKRGSDIYLISKASEPIIGSDYMTGNSISLSNLITLSIRFLQMIKLLNPLGMHLGAIDFEFCVLAQTAADKPPMLQFNSLIYGADNQRGNSPLEIMPFTAPEYIRRGQNQNLTSDIKALCGMIWTLLCGKHYTDIPDYSDTPIYGSESLFGLIRDTASDNNISDDALKRFNSSLHKFSDRLKKGEEEDCIIRFSSPEMQGEPVLEDPEPKPEELPVPEPTMEEGDVNELPPADEEQLHDPFGNPVTLTEDEDVEILPEDCIFVFDDLETAIQKRESEFKKEKRRKKRRILLPVLSGMLVLGIVAICVLDAMNIFAIPIKGIHDYVQKIGKIVFSQSIENPNAGLSNTPTPGEEQGQPVPGQNGDSSNPGVTQPIQSEAPHVIEENLSSLSPSSDYDNYPMFIENEEFEEDGSTDAVIMEEPTVEIMDPEPAQERETESLEKVLADYRRQQSANYPGPFPNDYIAPIPSTQNGKPPEANGQNMKLHDFGITDGLYVGLHTAKVAETLYTQQEAIPVSPDKEIIYVVLEVMNPNQGSRDILSSEIRAYRDGEEIFEPASDSLLYIDSIQQLPEYRIFTAMEALVFKAFEVTKGWGEITISFDESCSWTLTPFDLTMTKAVPESLLLYDAGLTPLPLMADGYSVQGTDCEIQWTGTEFSAESPVKQVFLSFDVTNTGTAPLDYDRAGQRYSFYINGVYSGNALYSGYTLPESLDGDNIRHIEYIQPGETRTVYAAFEIPADTYGSYVFVYNTGADSDEIQGVFCFREYPYQELVTLMTEEVRAAISGHDLITGADELIRNLEELADSPVVGLTEANDAFDIITAITHFDDMVAETSPSEPEV